VNHQQGSRRPEEHAAGEGGEGRRLAHLSDPISVVGSLDLLHAGESFSIATRGCSSDRRTRSIRETQPAIGRTIEKKF
jgi:hypothetical protein